MINFDYIIKEKIKEHNPIWSQILDDLYREIIVGGYRSGKTNLVFNPVSYQPDIDKHFFI